MPAYRKFAPKLEMQRFLIELQEVCIVFEERALWAIVMKVFIG